MTRTSPASGSGSGSASGTTPSWLPLVAAGTTLLLWASAFVAIRHLGRDVSPGALSLGRLLVASVALGLLLSRRRRVAPTRREWLLLLVCGSAWFGVYNLSLNAAERHVDAATAAMLVQVGPLLVALLAALFLGERLTGWLVVGMGVAFSGVVVIGLAIGEGPGGDVLGVLLGVAAAATYAIGVVSQKPLLRRLPALEVVCYACVIGAVVCLPWSGDLVGTVRTGSPTTLLLLVYLGVFPTAIAFTLWAYALSRTEASTLSVTTFLVPVLTTLLAWWLLSETPPATAYAGGALCVVGVLLSRRRPVALASSRESLTEAP